MLTNATQTCGCCGGSLPAQEVWERNRDSAGDCTGSVTSDGRCRAFADDSLWDDGTVECHDRLSGERFAVYDDDDLEKSIESYILDGIDADSGEVGYDVITSDGRTFSGSVTWLSR